MRVLIVDDEAPARLRLRQMLAAHADVEVAGEAETGVQAMELAVRLKPDAILLDIQMPGCTGIDVAACLPAPRPHIIFCTAYEQHAVDAFELNAIDYLLKPISRARLGQALERVRSLAPDSHEEALDQAARKQRSGPARFLVRSGAHYVVVGEARVLYFFSEGGLTRLIAENAQYWMVSDAQRTGTAARLLPLYAHITSCFDQPECGDGSPSFARRVGRSDAQERPAPRGQPPPVPRSAPSPRRARVSLGAQRPVPMLQAKSRSWSPAMG